MVTLNQFKQILRDEIKEREFHDERINKEYDDLLKELDGLENHPKYRPAEALLGSEKICPFCRGNLEISIASRFIASYDYLERIIYKCQCGYKYPDVRTV